LVALAKNRSETFLQGVLGIRLNGSDLQSRLWVIASSFGFFLNPF
jgi:hypothetical protein